MVITSKTQTDNYLFQNKKEGFLISSYRDTTFGSEEYNDEVPLSSKM